MKSADSLIEMRDFERYLRDAGISKKEALTFIARFKKAIRSDSEGPDITDEAEKIVDLLKNFHPLETSK